MNQSQNPIPLSYLSNQELELKLKTLVAKERNLLHVILEHIKEVETRRLYLERAYSSIFEYLVKELGYSGSAAMRRLEAARLLKEVPGVARKIQEGSLNLSQIGELSRAIKEKEKTTGTKVSALRKEDLVAAISGKSTQETQKELCSTLDIEIKEQERQRIQKDDSVRLELTFSKGQHEKLSQCRDLLAHLLQQGQKDYSWASVVEALADQYLNKKRITKKLTKESRGTDLDLKFETISDRDTCTNTDTSANTDTGTNADTNIIIAVNNGTKTDTAAKSDVSATVPLNVDGNIDADSGSDDSAHISHIQSEINSCSVVAAPLAAGEIVRLEPTSAPTKLTSASIFNRMPIRSSAPNPDLAPDRISDLAPTPVSNQVPQRTPIAAAVAGGSTKSLTPKIKAKIFKRDQCCQFEDPLSRKKCGSTFGLQIDHRTSRWAGGNHAETNLQLLCQRHNRMKYRKESGIRFI